MLILCHICLLDVSFLARFLCPEDEVIDEAIPWNWDSLFASVSTELKVGKGQGL
jgi:hypothetical protein